MVYYGMCSRRCAKRSTHFSPKLAAARHRLGIAGSLQGQRVRNIPPPPYSLYRTNLASFTMTGYNPKDAEASSIFSRCPSPCRRKETQPKAQAGHHEAKALE